MGGPPGTPASLAQYDIRPPLSGDPSFRHCWQSVSYREFRDLGLGPGPVTKEAGPEGNERRLPAL